MPSPLIPNRNRWLLDQCRGKSVLHIGCSDWPLTAQRLAAGELLHSKLAGITTRLVGVDPDQAGIDTLSRLMPGHQFVCAYAEDLHTALPSETFDVVLAADVVEHISNLGAALAGMRQMLAPSSKLIITTPSAFSAKRMGFLAVSGREHVHADHCYYFSPSTLTQCLTRARLRIDSLGYFMWTNPTLKNRLVNGLLYPLNVVTRGRLADELAAVCSLAE